MSIYGTTMDLDGDHDGACPASRPRRNRKGKRIVGECSCESDAPIIYQGSHVLPEDDDPRGGHLDLGVIAGWIARPGRPELELDRNHPWLRVSAGDDDHAVTIVLDRRQVDLLHQHLTHWLTTTEESPGDQ